MPRRIRDFLFCSVVLLLASLAGCTCGEGTIPDFGGGGQGGEGGQGGQGGEDLGPCGMDCSKIETPLCTVAVCNTGQEIGPINTCLVVPAETGTECDDGEFCTLGDYCDAGVCLSGETPNECGIDHSPCEAVICAESTQSCSVAPVNDGTECTPEDLCESNGVCHVGACVGEPKDCGLSPLNECNTVACDPDTGHCTGTPDPNKDNRPCVLTGDLCKVEKACQAGECVGGVEKDCSAINAGCEVGECQALTGICAPTTAPEGTSCEDGIAVCQIGECDASGNCKSFAAANGSVCNDHDACTQDDVCSSGACAEGSAVAGCTLYYKQGFEVCPSGWTFGGDWECGSPTFGPTAPHSGSGVIATVLDGVYSVNQSYTTTVADSPPIDLTTATSPKLSFWAWTHTEGGSFDGWNVKVSTNGGTSFTTVSTVTPAYPLTVGGQPAFGGDHSDDGWQNYQVDLSAYAGQTVILRFAFRSDGASVYPGVYIDDLFVAEPLQNPLYITTTSPLADLYSGQPYSVPIARNGGTPAAVWSIVPGGTNDAWLSIDSATGVLSGTPTPQQAGPVSVTVRVEEPGLPTNYDEKTFTFNVDYASYYTSFEGGCPAGWTLAGTNWQCGVPSAVGPATAFNGTQCIATRIAGNYTNNQTYTGSTATSPEIDLSGSPAPKVTFRMWIDTEGSTRDGVNLKVSTDGGATYTVLDAVSPPYPLTINGQSAWGGHQSGLGWQLVEANLAAFSGQIVRLQFSFRSDSSGVFPGVYIDDFLVQ